jgi:hypothetical protein
MVQQHYYQHGTVQPWCSRVGMTQQGRTQTRHMRVSLCRSIESSVFGT